MCYKRMTYKDQLIVVRRNGAFRSIESFHKINQHETRLLREQQVTLLSWDIFHSVSCHEKVSHNKKTMICSALFPLSYIYLKPNKFTYEIISMCREKSYFYNTTYLNTVLLASRGCLSFVAHFFKRVFLSFELYLLFYIQLSCVCGCYHGKSWTSKGEIT